jgi:hypothetical protein
MLRCVYFFFFFLMCPFFGNKASLPPEMRWCAGETLSDCCPDGLCLQEIWLCLKSFWETLSHLHLPHSPSGKGREAAYRHCVGFFLDPVGATVDRRPSSASQPGVWLLKPPGVLGKDRRVSETGAVALTTASIEQCSICSFTEPLTQEKFVVLMWCGIVLDPFSCRGGTVFWFTHSNT